MGEIADAMINGFYCEECGAFIDGKEPGYPRKCGSCQPRKRRKTKKPRQGGASSRQSKC